MYVRVLLGIICIAIVATSVYFIWSQFNLRQCAIVEGQLAVILIDIEDMTGAALRRGTLLQQIETIRFGADASVLVREAVRLEQMLDTC